MKTGKIVVVGLAAALVGVLALCGLTAVGTYAWLNANTAGVRLFYHEDTSYELIETETYPVDGAARLTVDTAFGDVSITTHEANVIEVEKVITAWGEDLDSAKRKAEKLSIEIEQTGDHLRIHYKPEESSEILAFGEVRADVVDFNIKVPAETSVKVDSSFGALSVQGITGGANLAGRFGDITVTDVTGPLVAKSANGAIVASSIEAGEESVHLETTFGSIKAEGVSGSSLYVRTSNGEIDLKKIDLEEGLAIENQFGAIRLEDFQAASLKLADTNGNVKLMNGTFNGPLDASTKFGSLDVQNVTAEKYVLETNNGDLSIDGARGEILLTNQFGDITVLNAEEAVLTAKSSNGKISFSGTLDEDVSHQLETSFGDIVLAIPEASSFSLSLNAHMGRIESEIPVSLSGAIEATHWEADMNGGGNLLTMKTNSGNIYILGLDATN